MGNYIVYKHTSPSGKVYIGITSQRPTKRWGLNGQNYSGSKYFWKAIQKYGWNNFTHEILCENLNQDEARELEMSLISEYRSNEEQFGYNITIGGGGAAGYKQTLEHIRKRTEKTTAKLLGRRLTEEHKKKISEGVRGEKNPHFGKHPSDETRRKLREAMTDEVKQKLLAAQSTPEARQKKVDAIRKRSSEFYAERNKGLRKPVAQYDPTTGELVAVYESARLAQEKTGTRFQDISACIHGRQKTAHGYRWELYKEVENECMTSNL